MRPKIGPDQRALSSRREGIIAWSNRVLAPNAPVSAHRHELSTSLILQVLPSGLLGLCLRPMEAAGAR